MTPTPAASEQPPDQPLSPELALVDPDLARWARERLPERRLEIAPAVWSPQRDHAAPTPTVPAQRARAAEPLRPLPVDLLEPPEPRRRLAWSARRQLGFVGILVICGVVGLTGFVAARQLREPASDTRASSAVAVRRDDGAAQAPNGSTGTHAVHVQAAAGAPAVSTTRSGRTTRSRTARRFVWPPDHRASYYVVQFFGNDRKIFERRVKQAELMLPASWTYRGRRYALGPGSYRWIVRPGYGRQPRDDLGRAIVRSSLTVP